MTVTKPKQKVYVISVEGKDICKIGLSTSPSWRLDTFQANSLDKLKLVYYTDDREDARIIERISHRLLKDKKIRPEWFDVSYEIGIETVKKAITISDNGEAKEYLAPKTYKYDRFAFSLSKEEQRMLNSLRFGYEKKHDTRISLSEMMRIMLKAVYEKSFEF